MSILIADVLKSGFFIWHRNSIGILLEKTVVLVAVWGAADNMQGHLIGKESVTRMLIPLYILTLMNALRVRLFS